ncbi:MAG: LppX_LprAFG lipoprotein [Acidimicrobiales bacterium]
MRRLLVAAVVGGAAVAGCASAPAAAAARPLLAAARATIDRTPALHFVLASQNLPAVGTTLQGGSGDLARPDQLEGTFQVSLDGLPASVKLIEAGGKFFAELPFTGHYQVTDPARFGLGDPAQLLNPGTGVSRLLTELGGSSVAGRRRVGGEVVEEISGAVPGADVAGLLPDVDPAEAVRLVLDIDPASHQVRQVALTGPFARPAVASTYVVTLTGYGEAVTIDQPPT